MKTSGHVMTNMVMLVWMISWAALVLEAFKAHMPIRILVICLAACLVMPFLALEVAVAEASFISEVQTYVTT